MIVVPVTCLCRPENEPMLVTYGQVSVCPHCKTGKYMIESAAYKFKETKLMVLVAQVAGV